MRKFALAIAATLGLIATPALAQNNFTGIRGEVTASVADINNARNLSDVNYGATVGIDAPLLGSNRFTIGAEIGSDNFFNSDRVISASARLGFVVTPRILVYGTAGYENYRNLGRNLDGVRVGGGLEFRLIGPFYSKAEYRYSDLQANTGRHQGLVGLGLRF